ncbi:hypothetical protein MCAG_05264 [Micromonospora sp. ATCC 39149]|uniref:Uncharacterized protein n=1 Tax=Micromonospora carbonacea TaxID=47853 RepID=A0A7D6GSQ8_9ACTN|nr:hypothetical protein [Micromonospora sp. ATCC 39149]EEP74937.1 hypothetical protein MCAG_05264 [Micromonospora sp. ATCC 39149]QLK00692.1 hypothetical protein HZU44_12200 [Micromonospora carbonacea]
MGFDGWAPARRDIEPDKGVDMKTSQSAAQAQAHDAGPPDVSNDPPAGTPRGKGGEALAVRTQVTAGGVRFNHSEGLTVRSDVRAGVVPIGANHSEAVALLGAPHA